MGCVLLCIFIVCSCFSSSIAQVVLNEVYYDHPGADGGWEFVELFNTSGSALALDGWALETRDGNGSDWKPLWRAAVDDSIAAGAVFVVGGVWVEPTPDAALTSSLQNGPDAIRLVAAGVAVDVLGYGDLEDAALFEGASAEDAPSGRSLGRYPDGVDSDNNQADFRVLEPSPGRLNRPAYNLVLSSRVERRLALPSGATDVIGLRISNTGTKAADGVTVTLSDSIGVALAVETSHAPIGVGDDWDVAFPVTSGDGYVSLVASLTWPPDERPGDNTLVLLRRFGGPSLLISEIMSDPPADCPEYVEVFNAGTIAVDISGYRLRDRVSRAVPFDVDGFVLAPDAFAVMTGDRAALLRWFPALAADKVLQAVGSWPSLNQGGSGEADSVVFADEFGLAVDRIAYPPQPASGRGRSLERIDLFVGDRAHTWLLSQGRGGGTPGQASGRSIEQPQAGGGVTVTPNPLDLSSGESLVVTVPAYNNVARVRVQVFDINGRRVADLGTSHRLPFVFVWNGRNAAGRTVRPGIFVLACEHWQASGARGVERVVVGCVEKRE